MPFTFSHPAAVLPLTYLPKKWTSMTCLIIGSLAPDFEYFLRTRIYSSISHTWTGLFLFDLPLTIILAFIFHSVIRDKLIDNLPTLLSQRLTNFQNFNWYGHFKVNFLTIIISAIFGIATHIVWDSFTHQHGHFVLIINELNSNISLAGYSVPCYKVLQHSSTIIGGLIIIYALMQLPSDKSFHRHHSIFPFWFLTGVVALLFIVIRLLTGLDYKLYGNVVVTTIMGGLLGLTISSLMSTRFTSLQR